ncbi:hypothetical protein BTUL_0018g00540 [Botrytis tulipae]|uniref:Uncharacterized protein n=1 Tax=Botrytis tulipae TaxID=87230 RepID=A0A4Z1F826_9HELO|nr:hypothetical protein BTUL_0018g00540 [Botrytis tulipae]
MGTVLRSPLCETDNDIRRPFYFKISTPLLVANQSVYQIYFFEPEEVGSTDHSTGILMKANPALTKMLVEGNVNGTGEAILWNVDWLPLRPEAYLIGKQSLMIMSKNTHPEHLASGQRAQPGQNPREVITLTVHLVTT